MITERELLWTAIGLFASFLFFIRWAAQTYLTVKLKRSHIPKIFWYISLLATFILLAYCIFYLSDWVMVIANIGALVIYILNLYYHTDDTPK